MSSTTAHHIKGIRPALEVMDSLGFSASQCLKGSGINVARLEDFAEGITLQQELAFYRNLLRLSGDPLIGLKLGRAFRVESYGLLGYAMLSARNLGEALSLASDFGVLAFSLFKFGFSVQDGVVGVGFTRHQSFDPKLLQIFVDRDVSAVISGAEAALGMRFQPKRVRLMHNGGGQYQRYQRFFGCPVEFDCARAELLFEASLIDTPMPQRDPETSNYCRVQCQHLLNKLSQQSSFVDQVRSLIVAQSGKFQPIEVVAEHLHCSVRTVRRRLAEEGSGYQILLNEIRNHLARDYLQTRLPIKQISEMLAYGEPANFSHAFKRWHGVSPQQYRRQIPEY